MESNQGLTPVSSTLPVAPYLGGKRGLAKQIIRRIEQIPHTAYVEPFVGMGGIFLRRPFRARGEVINDLNGDVANLFRILQRHHAPFMEMLKWQVTSRKEFEHLNRAKSDNLTDLERAARFLYLQRTAFGGKSRARAFGVDVTRSARFDVNAIAEMLEKVRDRLSGVVIECLPWADLVRRYDRPETLFYLDPPYWGNERDYDAPFSRDQFEQMAHQLASIKGRFILSLNDRPEVRQTFGQFRIDGVDVNYTINPKAAVRRGEVIISN